MKPMKGSGIVVSLDGRRAKVKVTSGDACHGCASRSNCVGGMNRESEIFVINECGAHISDHVVFEADTHKVILSAALLWILPLIFMITGYVVATRFTAGFWPMFVAFLFLAGSFFLLKFIDTAISGGKTFYPRITKILDASEPI